MNTFVLDLPFYFNDVLTLPAHVALQVLLATLSGQMPWIIPYVRKILPHLPIPSLRRMIEGREDLRKVSNLMLGWSLR
jgi:hypothetical protein